MGSGTWRLNWSDGQGASGSLNFGAGYASPTPLAVGSYGVQLGLLPGESTTARASPWPARTPRDTFQYTINREPLHASRS